MIFVGIDWAEHHHDVCVLDPDGQQLAAARLPEGVEGVGRLHTLVGEHAEEPAEVIVGIETDRGCWSGRCWPPATRCTRSTPWPPAATGNGT